MSMMPCLMSLGWLPGAHIRRSSKMKYVSVRSFSTVDMLREVSDGKNQVETRSVSELRGVSTIWRCQYLLFDIFF